jgi:SNF2 family DNA or RNA helicase
MIALQNMRMSCNSTYLLNQETDHGVKADELAALLDELFAEPEAKAVVFSQWTRTHDIVIRRLEARGLGYVSFHGGVPSEKRPALVERFRNDPACRVFLSTDAGSTGLNLQHASTVVNMDLPWNPAVLEQRIARIHRMGQTRPVQVINFVAKGTIANDPNAAAHPWIERDPATGAQNLKVPLPSPEAARQLANVLSAFADSLRGKIA